MELILTDCFQKIGITLAIFLLLIYTILKYKYTYWKKRGMVFIPPKVPFGNLASFILQKSSFFCTLKDIYIRMKSRGQRYIGLFFFVRPVLLIIDPKLSKRILTSDFQYFTGRGLPVTEVDPLSVNLFAIYGERWKYIRSKLSPTFSSGKLKNMLPQIIELIEQLLRVMKNETLIDVNELFSRLTTDVIASCAFGMKNDSISDPNNTFRLMGKRSTTESFHDIFRRVMLLSFPRVAKLFKISFVPVEIRKYMTSTVVNNINYRIKNKIYRPDFIQLIMEILKGETPTTSKYSFTMNDAVAQALTFYVAGFDTTANTLTLGLYELARNKNIQQKLRKEINEMLKNNNGEYTYTEIMGLPYLNCVFEGKYCIQ